jgi:hypothetical protein
MRSETTCPTCGERKRYLPPGRTVCRCTSQQEQTKARMMHKPQGRGVADAYAIPSFAELGRRAAEASRAAEPQAGTLQRLQELQGSPAVETSTPATPAEPATEAVPAAALESATATAVAEPATEAAPAKKGRRA